MSYLEERNKRKLGISPPLSFKKERKPIAKKSKKKIEEEKKEKEERGVEETELTKFFRICVKMMTGRCMETGLVTETKIFKYAVMSIAHILPKSKCPSVALHPCNWIELNVDFHVKFDAMSWDERERLGCWPVIRERLIMVWPDLAEGERRHFPDKLRTWIEENDVLATIYELGVGK